MEVFILNFVEVLRSKVYNVLKIGRVGNIMESMGKDLFFVI